MSWFRKIRTIQKLDDFSIKYISEISETLSLVVHKKFLKWMWKQIFKQKYWEIFAELHISCQLNCRIACKCGIPMLYVYPYLYTDNRMSHWYVNICDMIYNHCLLGNISSNLWITLNNWQTLSLACWVWTIYPICNISATAIKN